MPPLKHCFIVSLIACLAGRIARATPPTCFDPLVTEYRIPDEGKPYCASLLEDFPPLPGFRMPFPFFGDDTWPMIVASEAPPEIRQAADLIGKRLAKDGLATTLVAAIEAILSGNPDLHDDEKVSKALHAAGFPIDLLTYFERSTPAGDDSSGGIVERLRRAFHDGARGEALYATVKNWRWNFRQTIPNSRILTENGEYKIGTFRMQLTRGDDWLEPGDGGSIDIARQLVERFPDANICAAINQSHLPQFLATTERWPTMTGMFTVITVPFPITQWAQDNGKPVRISGESMARPDSHAVLIPRYASRREEASLFVPGDALVMNAFAQCGLTVRQSPLLFQGGNIMGVEDRAQKRTVLLIGEAEIAKNVALGLSQREVVEAFRIEFGAEVCCILPAISFHIDFDLTVRTVGDRTIAFVCDDSAGARLALAAGVGALVQGDVLDSERESTVIAALERDDPKQFLSIVGQALAAHVDRQGRFPERFAKLFTTGPADSHVGNLRLFLVAMDVFVHRVAKSSNPYTQAYLQSYERLVSDRLVLNEKLKQLGWEVVAVPAFGQGERAINPINGIQTKNAFLMPAIGGLYSNVDEAAGKIFNRTMGPDVEIIRIRCAESQRRAGGLHCSVSVQPK